MWAKVKEVLNDSDKLSECVNKALVELQERKSRIGSEILDVDGKLETLRKRMERLGMAFADGAIEENAYKSKLKQLKKQEVSLIKCRHNIGPLELTKLAEIEGRIAMVQNFLSQGKLIVSEFGIFGLKNYEYIPAGFNAWRECDGEPTIGEVTEMDYFLVEGTDKYMRGIDAPPGFWECEDYEEQSRISKRNVRAILQLFNISVIVFPDRVEIKGNIPQQVLYQGGS